MDAPTRGGGRMSSATTDSTKDSTVILQKLEARKWDRKRSLEEQKTRHETRRPVTSKSST